MRTIEIHQLHLHLDMAGREMLIDTLYQFYVQQESFLITYSTFIRRNLFKMKMSEAEVEYSDEKMSESDDEVLMDEFYSTNVL